LAAGAAILVALSGDSKEGPPDESASPVPTAETTVTVDGGVTFQRIDGFGSSERVFDDPHVFENFDKRTGRAKTVVPADERREIYDRLYRELRLTRVRPGPDGGIEVANDNGDPEVTDLSRFDFSWKLTDAHIDYVAEAMSRGAEVHFVSPAVEDWMETESGSPAEYAEWAMAMLRRWRDRGYEPPYYALLNEPGYYGRKVTAWQGAGSYGFSGEYLRDAAKLLGAKLRSEGFATKLVIPDDIRPSEAFERARVVLEDPGARRYVGAIATHLYGSPTDRSIAYDGLDELRSLADSHGLPLWMTEFYWPDAFEWAEIMHRLLHDYRVGAIDYLWGFFGKWDPAPARLITLTYDDSTGAYEGYQLEKQYYVFGQFSRFIPVGARRIEAKASDDELQTTAYRKGADLTIVAHNSGSAAKTVRFELTGLPGIARVRGTRTSAEEDWVRLALPVRDRSFVAALPPGSITTFVS
jgi:O-glycosyl hydrolase